LNAQQIGSPSADRRGALASLLVLSLFAGGSSGQEASPGSVRHDLDPQLRTVLLKAVVNADSFNDRFSAEVWLTDMSQRLAGEYRASTSACISSERFTTKPREARSLPNSFSQ